MEFAMFKAAKEALAIKFTAAYQKRNPGDPLEIFVMDGQQSLSFVLEGLKLVGSGNGAGSIAAVAALYYFGTNSALRLPLKVAGMFWVVGLFLYAVGLAAFIRGVGGLSVFNQYYQKDPDNIPEKTSTYGLDSLMWLMFGVFALFCSFLCFIMGLGIGIYTMAIA
jgi:hypothetical protein